MEKLINKKIVFHVHTNVSYDCGIKPHELVDTMIENGVDTVIITDHNSIKGAEKAKNYAETKYGNRLDVLIGEEVLTDIGDIIGFPIKEEIQDFDHKIVIEKMKTQGAYICLPHPFKSHELNRIEEEDFIDKMDFVEVFNSRLNNKLNEKAMVFAEKFNKKQLVGSDAHIKNELTNTHFRYDSSYQLIETKMELTSRRNIRLSQVINYYRKKRLELVIKYLLLFVVNK